MITRIGLNALDAADHSESAGMRIHLIPAIDALYVDIPVVVLVVPAVVVMSSLVTPPSAITITPATFGLRHVSITSIAMTAVLM